MPTEIDLEQLQTDVAARLNSSAYFVDVTVVELRKLQIQPEIDASLVHLTEKANKKGAGVIVSMPTIRVDAPNVAGPERLLILNLRVMESPIISQDTASGGSGKTAEAIALNIQDTLHQWQIEGLGTLYCDKDAMTPNTDVPGVVAYDVAVHMTLPRTQSNFCGMPDISGSAATLVTLTNTTSGATIYYTTDGSFPGSGNSAATIYTAPFAVSAGTVVRFAAYKTGLIGSDAGQATVN
jgi:hypothetical protein